MPREGVQRGVRVGEYKGIVYDPLTSTFALSCPYRGRAWLPLSAFRTLDRVRGTSRPAVFSVLFACPCGEDHSGFVTHDDLDVAPLGIGAAGTFRNLMTSKEEPVESELCDLAATRIGAGEWPWCFVCLLESRPRPISPSAITLITPEGERFGVAVRCPSCATVSVNLVSRQHVDIPFWNDPRVAVLDRVFRGSDADDVETLRVELASLELEDRTIEFTL